MARNKVGVPADNPTRYVGPSTSLIPIIKVSREPTTSDAKFPLGQFWMVGDSPTTGTVGDLWYLCDFVAGVPQWCQVDVGSGGPGVDKLRDQVDATASPDASGNIDIDGAVVANAANPSAIPLETVAGTNKITTQIQVGAAVTGAPGDTNDAGIVSFDDTSFSVDADGYVTLVGGGPALDGIVGDEGSGNVPDGSGEITITGDTVANATHAKPVYVDDAAASASTIDVQVAAAISSAPGDKNDAGLASFDSSQFSVDSNGFVQSIPGLPKMQQGNNCSYWNLSFTLSGGVVTLAGADGTALSASNPAYVSMPSNATAGRTVIHTIIANDTLTVSNLTGNLFGTTTAIAWGDSLPLYIGFMADSSDSNLEPIICRLPNLTVSPASSANIGDPSSATANLETSVFAWNDIVESSYQSMQIGLIGSLTATKAVMTNAWTLNALTNTDGIGKWNDKTIFTFSKGQNGAASGEYLKANGGTAPTFTASTTRMAYSLSREGFIDVSIRMIGDAGTDGSGAVSTQIALPIATSSFPLTDLKVIGGGYVNVNGSSTSVRFYSLASSAPTSCQMSYDSNGNVSTNADWVNGSRTIWGTVSYMCYNGIN